MKSWKNRSLLRWVVITLAVTVAAGCNLVDPERPTPQPDTVIFGNLLDIAPAGDDRGFQTVRLRVGSPRLLVKEQRKEGRPTSSVEGSVQAEVSVGPDTVLVLAEGRTLEDLPGGTEMVAVPVAGTTRMVGSKKVLAEAAYLLDFVSYSRWRLPKLQQGGGPPPAEDAARINSSGIEHAPVPLDGGKVLYFTARLRRPWQAGGPAIGARRPGLPDPAKGSEIVERAFRAELGKDGWSEPVPVIFSGIDGKTSVEVSWVSSGETRCLVTVIPPDGVPWVGVSVRSSKDEKWGKVERLELLGKEDSRDAVYLAGSTKMVVFSTSRRGSPDLFLFSSKSSEGPKPLDPRIDTPGPEWCPRVGPKNELLFCRGDRQLLYVGGVVRPLRLPGAFRKVLTEANPTRDGAWVFFCRPRYTPVDQDQDIWVAPWSADGKLGEAVAVDDWRPAD